MFKRLFEKLTGSKEHTEMVIVPKTDREYRQRQAEYYVQLLRKPTVDPDQPIAFHAQLRAVTFDFSESSLNALDDVLLSIRWCNSGDFDALTSTHAGLNLIVALSYYLGLSISFLGKLPMAWIGYEEALELNPSLPKRLDTDLGALFGSTLTFPANVIAEMLLNSLPDRTCASYAKTRISGVPSIDKLLSGLGKANALVAALRAREVTETEALISLWDHALYLPSAVPMQRRPPYASEGWRPIFVERHEQVCQMAFTNLHFADSWKQAEPEHSGGGVVPFSWIVGMIPNEVRLGVNIYTDSEWIISPAAITHCREILANRQGAA